MIDKDFEMSAELLTNEGYFTRYRRHLETMRTCKAAWEATEADLPFGLRRFTHYQSFQKALRMERQKSISQRVMLTLVPA